MRFIKLTFIFYFILFLNALTYSQKVNNLIKSRHDKWSEDLIYFEKEFVNKSKTYTKDSAESCKKAIKSLKSKIDNLNDNEIILELSRCVAMANNAHTNIHLFGMKRIPLRFFWFSDGLFIIIASNENCKYLGSKVLQINSTPIETVQKKLNSYLSGNENWKQYTETNFLSSPDFLSGIGIGVKDSLRLTMLLKGDTIAKWFKISELEEKNKYEAWVNLYPLDSTHNKQWKHILSTYNNPPLHLQNEDRGAFYKVFDTLKIAYFNINSEFYKGVKLNVVIDNFLDSIKKSPIKSVICDLRYFTGGNFMLALKLAKKLPNYIPKNGKIYLITSNMTFSAGLVTAARIKYFAKDKIVIVGENVGDNLKFRAEARYVKLPNSGVFMQDSRYQHDWINNKFIPFRTYWFNLLFGVPAKNLDVNKEIRLSFSDYLNKKDPVYDWIIEQVKK